MGLLERFAQGELEAFETLFRQFQREVYGWIIRIVRDPGIAEDLTVETFWRIYQARSRFDPARTFGAWARRIATNAAIDYLKTVRPEVLLTENHAPEVPQNPAVQRDLRDRIEQAFAHLPDNARVAAFGAKLSSNGFGRTFNPFLKLLFNLSFSTTPRPDYQPWRMLAKYVEELDVREYFFGLMFLASCVKEHSDCRPDRPDIPA